MEKEISELGRAYQDIGDLIPQTGESLWSGHFFPWKESWEDLQISCDLCLFGLYKQAMVSLRSALEVGLLSVYWNLNDDGHQAVQEWLRSNEDTPRGGAIWAKLCQHRNFQDFGKEHDLRSRILSLGYLHDYAHTKGHRFSNDFGLLKSNFQTFEEKAFRKWFKGFREVMEVLSICHLVKYPLGTVRFSYFTKFGIDTPMFGGLDGDQVDRLAEVAGPQVFETIAKIGRSDPYVKAILDWLDGLPDMTEEDVERQIVDMDKTEIEMWGLSRWLENQRYSPSTERREKRIALLKAWAAEHGYDAPRPEQD